jgi:protoporphyrinogen oxidase
MVCGGLSSGEHGTDRAVDVAIIGAGPAGLTAAYLLTKAGYSVCVIEKDERYVGGISRTVEHEGYRFDIGGHRFFSNLRRLSICGTKSCPMISSSARA